MKLKLFLLLLLLLPVVALGQETQIDNARNLKTATIAVYLQDIGDVNVKSGSYDLDFWVGFKCDQQCLLEDFNIINGRIQQVSAPSKFEGMLVYRIQARFSAPIDLHNYPFDEQNLTIIIEPRAGKIGNPKISLNTKFTGVDERLFFPGWGLDGFSVKTEPYYYPAFNSTSESYTFGIKLAREKLDGFIKNFLPLIFMILIVLFTFILELNKTELRLGVVSSVLIAVVVLHLSLTDQLPSLGYMTYLDEFIMITYFITIVAFFLNITLIHLMNSKKLKLAKKIHEYTQYSFPLALALMYLAHYAIFLG